MYMTKCFWTTVRFPYSITKHVSSNKNQATIWNYILTAYKYFCLSFCMLTCVTASTRLLDLSRNKVGRPYHLYKIVLTTVPECPTLIASSSLSFRYDCVSKPTTSWNFTHTHTHIVPVTTVTKSHLAGEFEVYLIKWQQWASSGSHESADQHPEFPLTLGLQHSNLKLLWKPQNCPQLRF